MANEPEGETPNVSNKSFLFKILVYLILIGIGAGGTYYLAKTRPGLIGLPKTQAENQAEANEIIAKVGKLITLPSDETPTVATVTNAEQLKDQPFFKNAKNGDKILVYQNANKAIIYRPSENRIIDVGAVGVTATPAPSGSPKATPTPVKPTPSATPAASSTP